jgi:hypothetical protein
VKPEKNGLFYRTLPVLMPASPSLWDACDFSFKKWMRRRNMRHRSHAFDFHNRGIRFPLQVTEQWILIMAQTFRNAASSYRFVKHSAQ